MPTSCPSIDLNICLFRTPEQSLSLRRRQWQKWVGNGISRFPIAVTRKGWRLSSVVCINPAFSGALETDQHPHEHQQGPDIELGLGPAVVVKAAHAVIYVPLVSPRHRAGAALVCLKRQVLAPDQAGFFATRSISADMP